MSNTSKKSKIKPINIAYATLAYFTKMAVTIPPIVEAMPEEMSNATKNPVSLSRSLKKLSHLSKGVMPE